MGLKALAIATAACILFGACSSDKTTPAATAGSLTSSDPPPPLAVAGWSVSQASPDGYSLTGTKCDSRDGEWVFRGALDSGGVHSEVVYTITIGKDSLDGTYEWSNSTVVADAVVAVNASGHASIASQKDGSVVMKLDASSATSTAAGAGGQQTVAVPFPAQSFNWKVDAASCDQPN